MTACYVGIDYSINSPALCVSEKPDPGIADCRFFALAQRKMDMKLTMPHSIHLYDKPQLADAYRISKYAATADFMSGLLRNLGYDTHHIFIEGYSYASVSSMAVQMAENGGLMRYMCSKLPNTTIVEVAPSVVKKNASGRGNAKKHEMYASWIYHGGYHLLDIFKTQNEGLNPLSDIVDSFFILRAGTRLLKLDILNT